uniref:Uncharacterized protein n=1 Tax=Odontella aurita TaxID=265563 RepID=A0A7S4MQU1_9STRA
MAQENTVRPSPSVFEREVDDAKAAKMSTEDTISKSAAANIERSNDTAESTTVGKAQDALHEPEAEAESILQPEGLEPAASAAATLAPPSKEPLKPEDFAKGVAETLLKGAGQTALSALKGTLWLGELGAKAAAKEIAALTDTRSDVEKALAELAEVDEELGREVAEALRLAEEAAAGNRGGYEEPSKEEEEEEKGITMSNIPKEGESVEIEAISEAQLMEEERVERGSTNVVFPVMEEAAIAPELENDAKDAIVVEASLNAAADDEAANVSDITKVIQEVLDEEADEELPVAAVDWVVEADGRADALEESEHKFEEISGWAKGYDTRLVNMIDPNREKAEKSAKREMVRERLRMMAAASSGGGLSEKPVVRADSTEPVNAPDTPIMESETTPVPYAFARGSRGQEPRASIGAPAFPPKSAMPIPEKIAGEVDPVSSINAQDWVLEGDNDGFENHRPGGESEEGLFATTSGSQPEGWISAHPEGEPFHTYNHAAGHAPPGSPGDRQILDRSHVPMDIVSDTLEDGTTVHNRTQVHRPPVPFLPPDPPVAKDEPASANVRPDLPFFPPDPAMRRQRHEMPAEPRKDEGRYADSSVWTQGSEEQMVNVLDPMVRGSVNVGGASANKEVTPNDIEHNLANARPDDTRGKKGPDASYSRVFNQLMGGDQAMRARSAVEDQNAQGGNGQPGDWVPPAEGSSSHTDPSTKRENASVEVPPLDDTAGRKRPASYAHLFDALMGGDQVAKDRSKQNKSVKRNGGRSEGWIPSRIKDSSSVADPEARRSTTPRAFVRDSRNISTSETPSISGETILNDATTAERNGTSDRPSPEFADSSSWNRGSAEGLMNVIDPMVGKTNATENPASIGDGGAATAGAMPVSGNAEGGRAAPYELLFDHLMAVDGVVQETQDLGPEMHQPPPGMKQNRPPERWLPPSVRSTSLSTMFDPNIGDWTDPRSPPTGREYVGPAESSHYYYNAQDSMAMNSIADGTVWYNSRRGNPLWETSSYYAEGGQQGGYYPEGGRRDRMDTKHLMTIVEDETSHDGAPAKEEGDVSSTEGSEKEQMIQAEEAVRAMKQKAEEGDESAMCALGNWYSNGQHFLPEDKAVGYAWYQRATDYGSVKGMTAAGICLLTGDGIEPNEAEGMALLGAAAQGGSDLAAYWLGVSYKEGARGLPRNLHRAKIWFQRLVNKGEGGVKLDGIPFQRIEDLLRQVENEDVAEA